MENRRKPAPPAATLDINCDCKEYVIDYLERAFPTRQMQARIDDTGTPYSVPMSDEHGHPVYNPDAVAMRETLIEQLCALPPIKSVLDALLERFGTDRVAEVTGRTKRLVTGSDGRQKIESRSPRAGQADASAFMAGQKRILVFSYAGGTGRSYHASLDAQNQQQRVHLLLEPGWRADRAIQGLGRTHRTHQASTPLFRPVTTNCKGELRFTSTIARRLDTLGALTRGQRQTGGQNLFDPADNLESDYAKAALITWFHLLNAGKLRSTNMADFQARSGLMLLDKDGVLKDDLPPIQRWLNRILALPIALQNEIFDEFLALVTTRVEAAREAGTLDIGVETIMAEQIRVLDDKLLRTDPVCGATTYLLTLEITRQRKAMSLRRAHQLAAQDPGARLMINAKSSKCAIAFAAPFGMDNEGNLIGRTELRRPGRSDYIRTDRLGETAWEEVGPEDFDAAWEAELAHITAHPEVDIVHLAAGLLLPIWGALPADHLTVNRVVDAHGNSWLGRMLHEGEVAKLLRHLGLDADTALSPSAILQSVMAGQSVELAAPIATTVKRSLVDGHQRIELVGVPPAHLPMLKTLGCFTEIIAYRTRVFVPIERADAIFAALQPSRA